MSDSAALLTLGEMYRADQAAMAAGIPGARLMEAAGGAVAAAILERWSRTPTVVLCGPGNNGGDGFVIARWLQEAGWPVRVALLGRADRLTGDAAAAARRWHGPIQDLSPTVLAGQGLVVDALFGAGLQRPVDGMPRQVLEAVIRQGLPVVAVDMPSGIHGDSGQVLGIAVRADLTVTFVRPKPGHRLMPGRAHCGELVVADIGMPAWVLGDIAPRQFDNRPALWRPAFPRPDAAGHKYHRGHATILGGATMTGAARLAARAALRIGAGLVTLACPTAAWPIYAGALEAVMVTAADDDDAHGALLKDPRRNVFLLGPGLGGGPATQHRVRQVLTAEKAAVLDADAITAFASDPAQLVGLLNRTPGPHVLTPHEGEFARLFSSVDDKLTRSRRVARETGAVMVLKGADTVIAAPDGRAVINDNAPADLATAGAGDVLAGMITGLLAQGMPAFEAACAGVWLHGEAGRTFGPGLTADDLAPTLPAVLRRFRSAG